MTIPKKRALRLIQNALDQIPELRQADRRSQQFILWQRDTRVALENIFGSDANQVDEFVKIRYFVRPLIAAVPVDQLAFFRRGIDLAKPILESVHNEINNFFPDDNEEPIPEQPLLESTSAKHNVFVVHGRDEGAKDTVTRFIENLSLNAIVLKEQPDQGQTIIEKFEYYADEADFAVVLCTPDDSGGLVDGGATNEQRARQNVIFELGHFVGKYGRKNVALVVKGDVDFPSDYYGVLYTRLDDSGGWKLNLVRELKTAGFSIDANQIVGI